MNKSILIFSTILCFLNCTKTCMASITPYIARVKVYKYSNSQPYLNAVSSVGFRTGRDTILNIDKPGHRISTDYIPILTGGNLAQIEDEKTFEKLILDDVFNSAFIEVLISESFSNATGSGTVGNPEASPINAETIIPINSCIYNKYIKKGHLLTYEIELMPSLRLSIKPLLTKDYSSLDYVSLECMQPMYPNNAYVWEYSVEGAPYKTYSLRGSNIAINLQSLPDAKPGDEIYFRLRYAQGYSNVVNFRYYPELPYPISSNNQLIKIRQTFLDTLNILINRPLKPLLQEKFTVLTVYDSVLYYVNNGHLISESRVVFQKDISNLKFSNLLSIPLDNIKLTPKKYYISLEGTVRMTSNKDVKKLDPNIQMAIFKIVPFHVYSSQIKIKSINVSPPICHNGNGLVKINIDAKNLAKVERYLIYVAKESKWQLIEEDCKVDFEFELPPGDHNIKINHNINAVETILSITVPNVPEIDFPVEVKNTGGVSFAYNIPQPATKGHIFIDRAKVKNGLAPYFFRYGNSIKTLPLAKDTIFTEPNQIYLINARDANGCTATKRVFTKKDLDSLHVRISEKQNLFCYEKNEGKVVAKLEKGKNVQISWYKNNVLLPVSGLNIINASSGFYTVKVKDNTSLLESIDSVYISQPSPLIILDTIYDVKCKGAADGRIGISAQGGTTPYSYLWEENSSKGNLEGIKAGLYKLQVLDANMCFAQKSLIVKEPSKIMDVLELNIEDAYINTENKEIGGKIELRVQGGVPPYSYRWSDGNFNLSRIGLKKGWYTLKVVDAVGCEQTKSFEINVLSKLNISSSHLLSPSCYQKNNGKIEIQVHGGKKPYRYQWSSGENTNFIENLTAGDYEVNVQDGNNEKIKMSFSLPQPKPLKSDSCKVIHPTYFGAKQGDLEESKPNGQIEVFTTGGVTPYRYTWNSLSSSSSKLDGLTPGVYSLDIYDANGCNVSSNFKIEERLPFVAKIKIIDSIRCNSDNNGKIQGLIEGGLPPYSWFWVVNETDTIRQELSLSSLKKGIYDFFVTDSNKVQSSFRLHLNDPNPISITNKMIIPPTYYACEPSQIIPTEKDAMILLSVNGGNGEFRYLWSHQNDFLNEDEGKLQKGLQGGDYAVLIEDRKGCKFRDSVVIPIISPLVARIDETSPIYCYGGKTGELKIDISGGVSPYSYFWSNMETSSNITKLKADIYVVTVKDANLKTMTLTYQLGQPNVLNITSQALPSLCNGDSSGLIIASAQGGIPPYQYTWSNGQIGDTCKGLETEKITLHVNDANSCATRKEIDIEAPPKIKILADTLNPSYGSTQFKVKPKESRDGYIYLRASGGVGDFKYTWQHTDTDTNVVDKLGNGTYTVLVEDENYCQIQRQFQLGSLPLLETNVELIKHPLCYLDTNGAFRLTIKGGKPPYKITSNEKIPSDTIFSKLPQGYYRVNVQDANGVKSSDSIYLWHPSPLLLLGYTDSVSGWGAKDGQVGVIAKGGIPPYIYQWGNGGKDSVLLNVKAGRYTVIVEDKNKCFKLLEIPVFSPDSLRLQSKIKNCDYYGAMQGVEPSFTPNGEIEVNVNGGVPPYHYQWSHSLENSAKITNLNPNTYYLKVTDTKGYFLLDSFVITRPECLIVNIVEDSPVRCFGNKDATLRAVVQGGIPPYTYKWSNNLSDSILSNLEKGIYQVIVKDSKQISSSYFFEVKEPKRLQLNTLIDSTSGAERNDGSLLALAKGGTPPYLYCGVDRNWYDASNIWTKLPAGLYSLSVQDQNGCKDSLWAMIHAPSVLDADIHIRHTSYGGFRLGEKDSVKGNGEITVSPKGGTPPYTMLWNNGETSGELKGLTKGFYFLQIQDKFLNEKGVLVEIKQNDFLEAKIQVKQAINCYGALNGALKAVVNGGVPPYTYYWNDSMGKAEIDSIPSGAYYLKVIDSNGVESHYNYFFEQSDSLVLNIQIENISCTNFNNGNIKFHMSGGVPPYEYYLNNNKVKSICSNLSPGLYSAKVMDANHCHTEQQFKIKEPDSLSAKWSIKNPTYTGTNENLEGEKINDGEISIYPFGGSPPYRLEWNTKDTSFFLTKLKDGFYEVTLFDAQNCPWRKTFSIKTPLPLKTEIAHYKHNKCYGDTLDKLSAIISGGIPPYKIIWNTQDTSSMLHSLNVGKFTLNVRDRMGVFATKSIEIDSISKIILEIDSKNPKCNGFSDGEILVKVKGGTYPYTYVWNTPSRNPFLSNVGEGRYIIKVEDKYYCSSTDTINLKAPSPLAVDADISQPLCYQDIGKIWVNISGGIPPYSYQWRNQSKSLDEQTNSVVYSGLNDGHYFLKISDSNSCSIDTSFKLNSRPPLNIDLDSLRYICAGQTITLSPQVDLPSATETKDSLSLVYLWLLPDGSMENTEQIEAKQNGIHSLTLIEHGVCLYYDTVYIESSQDSISSLFLINTDMYTGESFLAVNISHPKPDSIAWILPKEAKCLDKNGDYIELLFSDTGYFVLKLLTYKNQCMEVRETGLYVKKRTINKSKTVSSILQFAEVFPNPIKDKCVLRYQVCENENIYWSIIDGSSSIEIASGLWGSKKNEIYEKDLGTYFSHKGIYILHLKIGKETQLFKLIHL